MAQLYVTLILSSIITSNNTLRILVAITYKD